MQNASIFVTNVILVSPGAPDWAAARLFASTLHVTLKRMTITQTVDIPADHRLTIDIPREVPAGATARLELVWSLPDKAGGSLDAALETIWTLCKDAPVTVDSFLATRRRDGELEEGKHRRLFAQSGDAT